MAESTDYIVAPADNEPAVVAAAAAQIAIGIDLGTSSCSVAVWKHGSVHLLLDSASLPSVVAFGDAGGDVDTPLSLALASPSRDQIAAGAAVFNAKRLLGRTDSDPTLLKDKPFLPFMVQTLGIGVYPVLAALSRNAWHSTTPEEVLAILLLELRAHAEAHLGCTVRTVVLTVPVSFGRAQLGRLHRACAMAGLHVLRLMPEPTAIALVYAQHQQQASQFNAAGSGTEKVALIFNMGSGYCDVAVTATAGGVSQIKALAGDCIGGEDLLRNLITYILKEFESFPPSPGRKRPDRSNLGASLRAPAQDAIHALSQSNEVELEAAVGGRKFSRTVTREEFERANATVFDICEALIAQCLRDAQVSVDALSDIVLVGGCANIPRIRTLVQNACGGKDLYQEMDIFESTATGAALEAAIASGISDPSGKLDLLTIQAMPHTVGLQTSGDEFLPIVPRNSTIPARRDVAVTTTHDNQTEALIMVYEGESRKASQNRLLGFFKISGIPPAPKGTPSITVCVDVDASDVLRVLAGVYIAESLHRVLPLVEVRMPTVEDGHGWCCDAILNKYGSTLDVSLPPK